MRGSVRRGGGDAGGLGRWLADLVPWKRPPGERAREAVMAASPDPVVVWTEDGGMAGSADAVALIGRVEGLRPDQLAAQLAGSASERLAAAILALDQDGIGFQQSFDLATTGQPVTVVGGRRHIHDGVRVTALWLRDGTELETARLTAEEAELAAQEASARAADAEAGARRITRLLDAVPLPLWLRDSDGRVALFNQDFADAVGQDRPAIAEDPDVIANAILERTGRTLAAGARGDGAPRLEDRNIVVGGTRHRFRIAEVPLEGEPGWTVGYAIDRTAEDNIRAELARHISAHAEVMQQLRTAIAIYGADMRLTFYNTAWLQLWGLEAGWAQGQPRLSEVLEVLREKRQLQEQADFRQYKQQRLEFFQSLREPYEELIYRPDGTILRMIAVPHPLGGLMFSIEDVSGRLSIESSYNTLVAVQRETLENLAEAIAVFGGDGRLKLWNPAFTRAWNLADADLANEPHVSELAPSLQNVIGADPRDPDRVGNTLVALVLARIQRSGRVTRADGTVLTFHAVPLPDGGVLLGFTDITDTVAIEHALRERNAALEAAGQIKMDFFANVSYQLRTPLNALMGFGTMLLSGYAGELGERQVDYLKDMVAAGDRLVHLVDSILDLAEVETGRLRLSRQPTDMRALLDETYELTLDWVLRERLNLDYEPQGDLGMADVDPARLRQALVNLIANAIRVTPAGGRVRLSAEREVDLLQLIVSDTGTGAPDEEPERLFNPFLPEETRVGPAGSGITLALAKSLIELHDGTITVAADPTAGTAVICTIPAASLAADC